MEVCSKKIRAHFHLEVCSDFFFSSTLPFGGFARFLFVVISLAFASAKTFTAAFASPSFAVVLSCICQCKDIHGSSCLRSCGASDVGPVRWRHRAELAPAAAPLAVAVAAALADGDLDEEAITEDKRA